jgi:hypothetical protein
MVLAAAVALALTGCGGPSSGMAGATGPSISPSPSSGPTAPMPGVGRPVDPTADRTVAIYTAVIRGIVLHDNTFGGHGNPFGRVYLMDAPQAGVGLAGEAGTSTPSPLPEFDPAVRAGLLENLRDLPIEFIHDHDAVMDESTHAPRDHGAVITLGPITGKGDRVEVGTGMFCGGTCGQWATYVLERRPDGWHTNGTTGPVSIS